MVRFMVIGLAAALCAVGAARGISEMNIQHAQTATVVTVNEPPLRPAPPPAPYLGSGEASIAKSPDGHFWADAQVDGHPVRFLIDTGASAVSLSAADARNLGINTGGLTYSQPVMTANGPAMAAQVKLGLVSVGRAEVQNVDALVIDKGLDTSLLGMSYLGRLAKFEATPDAMDLKS